MSFPSHVGTYSCSHHPLGFQGRLRDGAGTGTEAPLIPLQQSSLKTSTSLVVPCKRTYYSRPGSYQLHQMCPPCPSSPGKEVAPSTTRKNKQGWIFPASSLLALLPSSSISCPNSWPGDMQGHAGPWLETLVGRPELSDTSMFISCIHPIFHIQIKEQVGKFVLQ